MDLFKVLRRGPGTTEFWATLAGLGIGLFAVKEGVPILDAASVLAATVLPYVGSRTAVKVAGAIASARAGVAKGDDIRDTARGYDGGVQ